MSSLATEIRCAHEVAPSDYNNDEWAPIHARWADTISTLERELADERSKLQSAEASIAGLHDMREKLERELEEAREYNQQLLARIDRGNALTQAAEARLAAVAEWRERYRVSMTRTQLTALDAALSAPAEPAAVFMVGEGRFAPRPPAEPAEPQSLLQKPGDKPTHCHCPPDKCMAPRIMGQQMPCLRAAPASPKASTWCPEDACPSNPNLRGKP